MNLFDFIVANKDSLEKIYNEEEITVDASEFNFSYPGVDVENDDGDMVFSVGIGNLKVRCEIDEDSLLTAVNTLVAIKDTQVRKTLIEVIEEQFRSEAEDAKNEADDRLKEAQTDAKDANERFNDVVASLGVLKRAWNIP